jgi:hypothetical protein
MPHKSGGFKLGLGHAFLPFQNIIKSVSRAIDDSFRRKMTDEIVLRLRDALFEPYEE